MAPSHLLSSSIPITDDSEAIPISSSPTTPSINNVAAANTTQIAATVGIPQSDSGVYPQVIPDEDPQRAAEAIDDDEDGVGEGIGEEDEEQDDGDEVEDEPVCVDGAPNPRPRKRRLLPAWLLVPFKAKVEESKQRDTNGLPPLYAHHQTFWFPQKLTFFLLQWPGISPPDLYNPRFFLWDPEVLCNRIPCPNCQWPLHRHTHISHPCRCVDADSTFWMIGYRY